MILLIISLIIAVVWLVAVLITGGLKNEEIVSLKKENTILRRDLTNANTLITELEKENKQEDEVVEAIYEETKHKIDVLAKAYDIKAGKGSSKELLDTDYGRRTSPYGKSVSFFRLHDDLTKSLARKPEERRMRPTAWPGDRNTGGYGVKLSEAKPSRQSYYDPTPSIVSSQSSYDDDSNRSYSSSYDSSSSSSGSSDSGGSGGGSSD